MMKAQFERVLALETSCDDTSVAIVMQNGWVEAVCSANQDLAHEPFGGVVPEIASRNHTLNILPLVDATLAKAGRSWADIDGLAVTSRPGLVGSLLVGLVTAKSLALARGLPLVTVNHLEGHLWAGLLSDSQTPAPEGLVFPFIGLIISGGHTHLILAKALGEYHVLGQTLDDAAGEAFDKFAKMAGLGFPGGIQVDRLAKSGDSSLFAFPRAMINEHHLNFSFSGLKTSAQNQWLKMDAEDRKANIHSICASYQEAIVDVLLAKLERAVRKTGVDRVLISGGVSANSRLRQAAQEWGDKQKILVVVPPLRYCTDNAAMIGYPGILRLNRGERASDEIGPCPRSLPDDFIHSVYT
jgi:N6-L-threonylcarbamoyladenine synthase